MSDRQPTGSDRAASASATRPSDRTAGGPMRRGGGPNYTIRRLAVGVAGLVVVVISVIVIARAFDGEEGRSSAGDVDAGWSHVVVLTADEILVTDPSDGEVVDRYPAAGDLLDDQSLVEGSMLVTMTDVGRITITDLTDGSVRRGQAGPDETMIRSRDATGIALIGPDVGGDLTVIDIATRNILSVGDVAGLDSPLMFASATRVNPGATHLAVSDGRSFQTIVVDLSEGAAIPLAGQIVAIDDQRVVTAQRAGASTELEFYDLAGARLGSVDLPTPVAAMLGPDGEVVTVDATGMVRLAGADGVDERDPLVRPTGDEGGDADEEPAGLATSGVDTASDTRLVVTDDDDTWVLDDRGEQLLVATGTVSSPITGLTRCAQIGGGFSATSTVVDVDRGRVVAELDGLVASITSVDGCTAAMLGSGGPVDGEVRVLVDEEGTGAIVYRDGDVLEVIGDAVDAVAPDGSAVAVADGRRTLLVDLDDGNAIELANEPVVVHFGER